VLFRRLFDCVDGSRDKQGMAGQWLNRRHIPVSVLRTGRICDTPPLEVRTVEKVQARESAMISKPKCFPGMCRRLNVDRCDTDL
jgi:hypothetical protein